MFRPDPEFSVNAEDALRLLYVARELADEQDPSNDFMRIVAQAFLAAIARRLTVPMADEYVDEAVLEKLSERGVFPFWDLPDPADT